MTSSANTQRKHSQAEPVTTYRERKINGTLYRVTSVFKGEIELGKALEDLTVKRILALDNSQPRHAG